MEFIVDPRSDNTEFAAESDDGMSFCSCGSGSAVGSGSVASVSAQLEAGTSSTRDVDVPFVTPKSVVPHTSEPPQPPPHNPPRKGVIRLAYKRCAYCTEHVGSGFIEHRRSHVEL